MVSFRSYGTPEALSLLRQSEFLDKSKLCHLTSSLNFEAMTAQLETTRLLTEIGSSLWMEK